LDFGDGTTSTSEDPNHVYAKSGDYTVKLTVTSADGCSYTTIENSVANVKTPERFHFMDRNDSTTLPIASLNSNSVALLVVLVFWRRKHF